MKLSDRFAIVNTTHHCFIETGTPVSYHTFGDRGTIRFKNTDQAYKECYTLSVGLMRAKKARVFFSKLNERFILKTADKKQYQVSKLSDCDFLHNYDDVLIIHDYRPNDFSTIIKAGDELCLSPSLRLIK